MKPIYATLTIIVVLMTADISLADTGDVHVIFVSGQSNMGSVPRPNRAAVDANIRFYEQGKSKSWSTLARQTRLGPELGVARKLYAAGYRNLAIYKCWQGGTPIEAFSKPDSAQYKRFFSKLNGWPKARALLAAGGNRVVPVGFFWMQGEADSRSDLPTGSARADAYEEQLRALITNYRTAIGAATLPFVLGRSNPGPVDGYDRDPKKNGAKAYAYLNKSVVRTAQTKVTDDATLQPAGWVDIDDMMPNNALVAPDHLHLTPRGCYQLGVRMAERLLELVKSDENAVRK